MSSRTALVTRCGEGNIGRACALRLAEEGYNLAIVDNASQQSELSRLEREISAKGVQCRSFQYKSLNEENIKDVVNNAAAQLGGLDVLVVNLSTCPSANPIISTSGEEFNNVMELNAGATFLFFKYAAQNMIKQGRGGRIIGGTGAFALQGLYPNLSAFSAASFALRGLTHTAALELGPHNITVNLIDAGVLEDSEPLRSQILNNLANVSGVKVNQAQDLIANRIPLGKKAATSEDFARVVSFVASKENDFMTGETVSVNGGILMQ